MDEEVEDEDHISLCSSTVCIDSDQQSDTDCPLVTRPVKQEPKTVGPVPPSTYDPDIAIESDDNVTILPTAVPKKPIAAVTAQTPRKRKRREGNARFTPEETNQILMAMRQKAYKQDLDTVQQHRAEKGITTVASENMDDHSEFVTRARRAPGSLPSLLIKTITDGRTDAKTQGKHKCDYELERISGKAFTLSMTLREDPNVIAPVPDHYAICFIRPVMGAVKTSTRSRVILRDDADRFGHVEMIGLYGLHHPDALKRRRYQTLEAAFCPLCSYCCNNNYTMNNHV